MKTKQDNEEEEEKAQEFFDFEKATLQSWGSFARIQHQAMPPDSSKFAFYINDAYFEQTKHQVDSAQNDELGSVNIPSKSSFWIILMEGTVYILSSRRAVSERIIDSYTLKDLQPNWVDSTGAERKSIEVLATDEKCISIHEKKAKTKEDLTILCFEQASFAKDWQNTLESEEEADYPWFDGAAGSPHNASGAQGGGRSGASATEKPPPPGLMDVKIEVSEKISNRKDNNGYWVVENDWSSCTKACGGGISTQQRRCIPPEPGYLPCQGDPIMSKPCNTDPCPTVAIATTSGGKDEVKPASIIMSPLSSDFQTYERCIVLSQDMDIARTDSNSGETSMIPMRVVVNNQTLSLFTGGNYQKVSNTVQLEKISVADDPENGSCIKLDSKPEMDLVVCTQNNVQGDHGEFIQKFKERLLFMKNNCHTIMPSKSQNMEQQKFQAKMMSVANQDLANVVSSTAQGQQIQNEEIQLSNETSDDYNKLMDDAMKQLQRELVVQGKIQQETAQKAQVESNDETVEFEQQKEKIQQLEDTDRLEDLQSENEQEKVKEKQKLEDTKKQIKQVVDNLRKHQEAKIRQENDLQDLMNRQKKDKITQLRIKTALETIQSAHVGNKFRCSLNTSEKEIETYCLKNFDDLDDVMLCKDKNEFCFQCCNKEFGSHRLVERKDCYNQMCGEKNESAWKLV